MSKDKLINEMPYKQRFKGVENFLRRVAFNLGNTASQTEVKIISCIPIDVTDLQQKVINLEKQLHEAKQQATSAPGHAGPIVVGDKEPSTSKQAAVVNTALYGTSFTNQPSTVSYYSDKPLENKSYQATCGNCTSKRRKSNVSFVFPALSTPQAEHACNCDSRENFDSDKDKNVAAAERYINIFKKRKRKRVCKGKSKIKTHLVYFAQHKQRNPFNLNEIAFKHVETLNGVPDLTSYEYLNNVIRRQYDPKYVVEEFSDTSHFSKPVCRDIDNTRLYESDVCSCCHGRFQNIDNYMTTTYEPMHRLTDYETNKTYYDSNLYDVIPVKENTNKFTKDDVLPKRNIEIKCWPENFRYKYPYDSIVLNYQTEVPFKRRTNKLYSQEIKHKTKPEENQTKVKQKRAKKEQRPCTETSKSCSIDCGDIYKKHNFPVTKLQKFEPVKAILLKNALIETDFVNTKLVLNNQSTQLELIPDEDKTESTLNQIKSILQSVLAEVKTSTKVNTAPDRTLKKDAIVQKGASQNNMQGESTLLHSFTYNNSYANSYLPCSRQVAGGQYCFTGLPYQPAVKCLQNFPVFIHPTSGRPMCACYYRNSSHKPSNNKQAIATATNTDKELQRASSKETEKLIKEIYKSMALNMDFPTKDTSVSEYEDLKSAEIEFNEIRTKSVKSTGMETVNKRDIEIEALITPNMSNNNKLVYTATSTQSEGIKYVNESRQFDRPVKNDAKHDATMRYQQHSADVIDEDDEETNMSNNETENDEVDYNEYEPPPKNEKKGLLQRVFRSVKLFKKRKAVQKQQSESDVENNTEASDSDDYETIYSGRTAKIAPRRNHNKMKSSDFNAMREKSRRLPYLEQEYRRRWNEGLMFEREQERKLSSERPFSKQSSKTTRPIFWNNYDARGALIKPNFPTELKYYNSNSHEKKSKQDSLDKIKNDSTEKEKLGWLRKHKLGINCGEQWKNFILEN